MNVLNKKLGKNGGFTLVEMLIVVAIIAILIAVSIPLVNTALEKSRHAVDDANRRDALALGTVKYLTEVEDIDWTKGSTWTAGIGSTPMYFMTYYYSVNSNQQGTLVGTQTAGVLPECTKMAGCNTGTGGDREYAATANNYLTVYVREDGLVSTNWDTGFGGASNEFDHIK